MRARPFAICLSTALTVLLAGAPAVAQERRDDGAISEEVMAKIANQWGNQGHGVIVSVEEGEVELWGQAPSQELADEAVRAALDTDGVALVDSHIEVGSTTQTARAPQQPADAAAQAQSPQSAPGQPAGATDQAQAPRQPQEQVAAAPTQR